MDWRQTQIIAESCRDVTVTPLGFFSSFPSSTSTICERAETNIFLGDHPSLGKVNSWFAGTLVAHTAVSYILPKPWRTIWQSVWIGIEGETVRRNYALGISVTW